MLTNWPISEEDQIRNEGFPFTAFTLLPELGNEELLIVRGLRVNDTLGFTLHRRLLMSLVRTTPQSCRSFQPLR